MENPFNTINRETAPISINNSKLASNKLLEKNEDSEKWIGTRIDTFTRDHKPDFVCPTLKESQSQNSSPDQEEEKEWLRWGKEKDIQAFELIRTLLEEKSITLESFFSSVSLS